MAKITVRTNGQTLTVNASVSHWTTAALAVAASGTNDVESTTTTTITSDYDMHFSNTATTAVITVKQANGTTLISQTFDVSVGVGPRVLNPVPDVYQIATDLSPSAPGGYATGMSTMPRWAVQTTSITLTSGSMRLCGFTAPRTETVTKVRFLSGATAAAATPTLVRVGLYSVDTAGAGTLVASTANDTTLAATQHTSYEKAFSASYTVTEGGLYAVGFLIVTAGATNTLVGSLNVSGGNVIGENAYLPRICGSLGSQTDLPASYTDASLSNTASVFYAVVSA